MVVMMTIGQQPPLAEHGKLGFEPAVKEKGNDELIITFTISIPKSHFCPFLLNL